MDKKPLFAALTNIFHLKSYIMQIKGIEHFSQLDLKNDVMSGGRFVIYQYVISFLVMTFRRASDIYYIPAGESAWKQGMACNFVSLFLGWWGLPWGLIYTPVAIFNNLSGGKNVTTEVMNHLTAGDRNFEALEKANTF